MSLGISQWSTWAIDGASRHWTVASVREPADQHRNQGLCAGDVEAIGRTVQLADSSVRARRRRLTEESSISSASCTAPTSIDPRRPTVHRHGVMSMGGRRFVAAIRVVVDRRTSEIVRGLRRNSGPLVSCAATIEHLRSTLNNLRTIVDQLAALMGAPGHRSSMPGCSPAGDGVRRAAAAVIRAEPLEPACAPPWPAAPDGAVIRPLATSADIHRDEEVSRTIDHVLSG